MTHLGLTQLKPDFMHIDCSDVNASIANRMDLATIGKKVDSAAYRSWEDFLSDVKWIEHNAKSRHLSE